MDFKKLFLYAALFFVCLNLWLAWQKDYPPMPAHHEVVSAEVSKEKGEESKENVNLASQKEIPFKMSSEDRLIHVRTDVFDLTIDLAGGNIIQAKLINYPQELKDSHEPFALLKASPEHLFVAKSDVFSNEQKKELIQYHATQSSYQLQQGKDSLSVTLVGTYKTQENPIEVTRIFTFKRGNYLIDQQFIVNNLSEKPWSGFVTNHFLQEEPLEKKGMFGMSSYTGASISDPSNKLYEKVSYSDIKKNSLDRSILGGWIALQQHYFLAAWVPPSKQHNHYFANETENGLYNIGLSSPLMTVPPKQKETASIQLYLGPEVAKDLKTIAPGLDYTIDYGWLWYVSIWIFWLLKQIYMIVGNWGWAIVLVTIIIKIAFYKLSSTSYRSMANMKKLQPRLQALKERYANDRQQLSMATMELYKKEKINPFGGCWPVLIQIPVFIALYWVLLESVELRQAPFVMWIKDLSAPDPYYVLPILMGATMLIQQMLSPASPDPVQAKMMMLLPLFFTFLFLNFPAGLVLYWVVNNGISIIQQWYITHKFELEEKKAKERRR